MEPKTIPFEVPSHDPKLPAGPWDGQWEKAESVGKIAGKVYAELRHELPEFPKAGLIIPEDLPKIPAKQAEEKTVAFTAPVKHEAQRAHLKGGAIGELFRTFTAANQPETYCHAQAVVFGVDDAGRFFLRAIVGRHRGGPGHKAGLVLRFLNDKKEVLGGISWQGPLDPPNDTVITLVGTSELLAKGFDKVAAAKVAFYAVPNEAAKK